jgi:staphylococcal nuclease domain-containing protein 1
VEYEKKVVPKIVEGEEDMKPKAEMLMTFVNVILLDKEEKVPNVSTHLVQAGLASVLPPRGDDGCSRHMDELRAAGETAMKSKKGIHGKDAQPPKLNDFTNKGGAGKAKESFQFLKSEKRISGVVDLVLNGCRLKVRVAQNNSLNLFLLQGIKCLPNDPNFPEFQKFSNLALQYAK